MQVEILTRQYALSVSYAAAYPSALVFPASIVIAGNYERKNHAFEEMTWTRNRMRPHALSLLLSASAISKFDKSALAALDRFGHRLGRKDRKSPDLNHKKG